MPFPIAAVGAGLAAGGVAGSLFGKKRVPTFNPGTANALANQGQQDEGVFLGNYLQGTKQNQGQFKADINQATEAAQNQSRQSAQDYLANFDPITSRIVQSRTDQLKQNLFSQIPELTQAAREAGAAGGGLDRGVIQNSLANIPVQQAAQFASGATDLQNQALTEQLNARSKVFDSQNQMILQKLGVDADTAEAILNSGNTALINELNGLIDSSRNAIGIKISADSAAQGSQIGNVQNLNADRQAIFNGLMGIGGTMLGQGLGGGASAAAPQSVTNNASIVRAGLQNQTTLPQRLSLPRGI